MEKGDAVCWVEVAQCGHLNMKARKGITGMAFPRCEGGEEVSCANIWGKNITEEEAT